MKLYVTTATLVAALAFGMTAAQADTFEVWAVDQANAANGGNKIYIYKGSHLEGDDCSNAVPEVIDLEGFNGGQSAVRPHMLLFNAAHTHAVLANVAEGGTEASYIIDAATRTLAQALVGDNHSAIPAPAVNPGNGADYIVTSAPAHTMLELWKGSYSPVSFSHVHEVHTGGLTLGAVTLPANAGVVCPVISDDGRYLYGTFNTGGLAVFEIDGTANGGLGELVLKDLYSPSEVVAVGCGGVQVGTTMYINSETANPAVNEHIYAFDTTAVGTHPAPLVDIVIGPTGVAPGNNTHGLAVVRRGQAQDYVWSFNRGSNNVNVIRAADNSVVNTFNIDTLPNGTVLDTAPDLADVSPNGNRVFVAMRGPVPLTANNPLFNNAVGSNPGVGVVQVKGGGKSGKLLCAVPIHAGTYTSGVNAGKETADIHSVSVRVIRDD